jgi:cell division protein FtsQ
VADVLTGESYVSGETPARREHATQRILIAVIIVLSVVLALELVYHLVLAPRLTIEEIELESDLPLSEERLLALAGVRVGMPYFKVDADQAAERITAHPVVKDAQVRTVFPNRITISATRRVPLAAALTSTPDGVVFRVGLTKGDADLAIVSGLRFEAVDVGLQLPALVVDFLEQLRRFKMDAPGLYRLFSEYRIVQKNEYAYEVVLYPMHYALPVRIGTSIDADMIQYVLMMLDVLQREGRLSSLAELDVRSGEGVLRPRDGDAQQSAADGRGDRGEGAADG